MYLRSSEEDEEEGGGSGVEQNGRVRLGCCGFLGFGGGVVVVVVVVRVLRGFWWWWRDRRIWRARNIGG